MAYGRAAFTRYREFKRAVEDKNMGPLVKTSMNRCIHCTRCIRFATEVAGVPDLGATGRGEDMEITTYLQEAIASELSGNVIDLCPVGALLSKPYSFTARPWELRKTESIDVMDGMGCNIRVDSRGREVMRFLPRINEAVNEEWLGDKSRFVWDGLKRQRLDQPYIRQNGRLQPVSWSEALSLAANKLKSTPADQIAAIAGDLAAAEEIKALKDLMHGLGVRNLDCRQDGAKLAASPRQGYLFNSGFAGVEAADALLLIGTNPRWEAPVLNARIRKAWLSGNLRVANAGQPYELTYPYEQLGETASVLQQIAAGEHAFSKVLTDAKRPMLIIGQGACSRSDGAAILQLAARIASKTGMIGPAGASAEGGWIGFNVLHTAASRVGALDLGFLPESGGRDLSGICEGAGSGDIGTVYLLGADEIDTGRLGRAFVIYQGTHGDAGAHRADIVLPGAAYTEKSGLYVNSEGRVQLAERATFPPGDAREDWAILRALSGAMGARLPYNDAESLRAAIIADAPHFAARDRLPAHVGADPAIWDKIGVAGNPDVRLPLQSHIADYYLTNAIARASSTMAECSRLFVRPERMAAE